jgi:maleylpyruvate isomerase
MNSAQVPAAADPRGEVDTLRSLMVVATQRLLGDTIAVTDEQWREASRLPGWTRGHVATHLARQADALVRLIEGARAGRTVPMYASADQRDEEIEAGAGRSGLDLQIDLDTAAGTLSALFETLAQESAWDGEVELRGGDRAPLRLLPLARLAEVVLHHVDLDIGMDIDDVDEPTAAWLLDWLAFRLGGREGFPRLHVSTPTGVSVVVGTAGDGIEVSGGSAQLLGWLTGRRDGASITGAEGVSLPAF